MHVRLIQTQVNVSPKYVVTQEDGSLLYWAEAPDNWAHSKVAFIKDGILLYELGLDEVERKKSVWKMWPNHKSAPFRFTGQDGGFVGSVYETRTAWWCGYHYYKYEIHGRSYEVYNIPLGREGRKIVMYAGRQQVALIEKGVLVIDKKDEYDLYSFDPYYLEIALLFCLYYDFITVRERLKKVRKKKMYEYVTVYRKKLRNWYDPTFKERCQGYGQRPGENGRL